MAEIFISTTSFKQENFVEVLDLYEKLSWKKLDVNLHPFLFEEDKVSEYIQYIKNKDFKVGFASGGWCDFFHKGEEWLKTETMLIRQIEAIKKIGVNRLRLFFGRLHKEDYSQGHLAQVVKNITSIATKYPEIKFSFENHDGASLDPKIVLQMIKGVNLPNVGVTLDAINYARVDSNPFEAIDLHKDFIFHVHVKGLTQDKHYCEYGAGDFDYDAFLDHLQAAGYKGDFTLEYEGEHNAVVKLNKSLEKLKKKISSF